MFSKTWDICKDLLCNTRVYILNILAIPIAKQTKGPNNP